MKSGMEFLIDHVSLSPHFQRSIRIDIDLNEEDILDGYLPQTTSTHVLENLAKQVLSSRQRAFTWTGPYGGGKSSLALYLSALVSPKKRLQKKAISLLEKAQNPSITSLFLAGKKPWIFLPITGSRDSFINLFYEALESHAPNYKKSLGRRSRDIVGVLEQLAETNDARILLVLDEMGKILEWTAAHEEDIFFFQELAEKCARSSQEIITIGILHQSFEQYASRLGKETREEWAKVQGRWIDLPLITTSDETISLISRAVEGNYPHPESERISKEIYRALKRRKPNLSAEIQNQFDSAWPLHPAVTAIIGSASRKKYGQNERSLFGFIASSEMSGLKDFLEHTEFNSATAYLLANYWDYLRTNYGPQIQGSQDSHKWSLALNALDRAEKYGPGHTEIVKTIATIDLFKDTSGLLATDEVLAVSTTLSQIELKSVLDELSRASIIIYRKHLESWALYAGSDFDLEKSLTEARRELGELSAEILSNLIDPAPVIAKLHYWQTGALRWFNKKVISYEGLVSKANLDFEDGADGAFCLVLPTKDLSNRTLIKKLEQESQKLISTGLDSGELAGLVLGAPLDKDAQNLLSLAADLAALNLIIKTKPELQGDAVARREVLGQIETTQVTLEAEIDAAIRSAVWIYNGEKLPFVRTQGISLLASNVANKIFSSCPYFDNEIINRQSLSSSAVKARRDLLYRMLSREHEIQLGYEGFSADAGLYFSTLQSSGVHQELNGVGAFICEKRANKQSPMLVALWKATDDLIASSEKGASFREIYAMWERPPFGIRRGIMPVLVFAYLLANKEQNSLYVDQIFLPKLSEIHIDEFLTSPQQYTIKRVVLHDIELKLLDELGQALAQTDGKLFRNTPLETARALVTRILKLPSWTRRTNELSESTLKIRTTLLAAQDPHVLLFKDLPQVIGTDESAKLVSALHLAIKELEGALPAKLRAIWAVVERSLELKNSNDYKSLHKRARTISKNASDPYIRGFITHLSEFEGTDEDILGLVSVAAGKTEKDLADFDLQRAKNQLLEWALEFRKLELLAHLTDRPAGRYVLNVALGVFDSRNDAVYQFEIDEDQRMLATDTARQLKNAIGELDKNTALAALAELSAALIKGDK